MAVRRARDAIRPLAAELIRVRGSMGGRIPTWCGQTDAFALGAAIGFARAVADSYLVKVPGKPDARRLIAPSRELALSPQQRRIVKLARNQLKALAGRPDIPAFSEVEYAVNAEVGAAILARAAGGTGVLSAAPGNRDGSPGTTKTPRRGRPKADYETVKREAKLAADWEQASKVGVYKGDFAKDNGSSVKEFDKLLDRVAKRNRASE
jgi:hypothetical protein